MKTVTPITFNNPDGLKLFGIVNEPASEIKKSTGIVLLSPGVKTRVAPHRLYKRMADNFCSLGYTVFRFDFYGLGDSEGEIDEYYLADFYGTVGVGRYIDDSRAAFDWLEKEYGISNVVVAGLCGGSLTGLLAGANDERVVGLIGLGTPVVLDSTNIDKSKYVTQGQLKVLKAGYIEKLFDPKSWLRLLTFKSDLRIILKVISQVLFKKKQKHVSSIKKTGDTNNYNDNDGNFNTLFPPAFFKMTAEKRKVLFIFSGADRLAWEFEEKFTAVYNERLAKCTSNYEIHTIENANHVLSDKKWLVEMMEYSNKWLKNYYDE